MLNPQELSGIVEPLLKLTDLQVYLKLDELKLPPSARDRVLRELANRRQGDLIDRALSENDHSYSIPIGGGIDDVLDAMLGIAKETK